MRRRRSYRYRPAQTKPPPNPMLGVWYYGIGLLAGFFGSAVLFALLVLLLR